VDGAVEENMKVVEEAAREAAGRGAKVLCFPECMDLGWVNVRAHELAVPIPGPTSDRVAALSKALGVYIAVGLTERIEGGICDAAILVGPGGELLLKHRKVNTLVELLTPPYIRGRKEDIAAVDTPLGRMGLLICADTFVEEILDAMRAQRPDLLLVPYGWAAPSEDWPGHGEELKKTVSRAARVVGAPVIGPTPIGEITSGPWKGRTYRGESAAADREGNITFFGLTGRRQVAVFPVPIRPAEARGL
jgi:N-carbamoylputrescine amidase